MANEKTVNDLFDLAVSAELAAKRLYERLADKFDHHPEVAAFWRQYATEEESHAQWQERMRSRLTEEQLAQPADLLIMQEAIKTLEFSVEQALQDITNLEEAYQLVNELENGETNAIFEFLIEHFSEDETARRFLRSQLKDHIRKLMIDLPIQFKGAVNRQAIKVKH
jgi:rubrerythrin